MNRFRRHMLVCLSSVLLLSGCGPSGPQVAEVSGIVTLKGKPLELVTVEFWPVADGGKRSHGKTDKEGKFTLKTDDGLQTGASVGSHKVLLRDTWPMQDDYIDKDSGEMVDMSKGRKSRIAWKFFEVTTTPLTADVKAGEKNEVKFEAQ